MLNVKHFHTLMDGHHQGLAPSRCSMINLRINMHKYMKEDPRKEEEVLLIGGRVAEGIC